MNVFGEKLEPACLSVCVQNTCNFVSQTPPTVCFYCMESFLKP